MIQVIDSDRIFVSNLKQFISKADKFIKTYYSGVSDENQVQEIVQELKNLVLDTDLKQLEIDYQNYCEIKDLMGDCDESAWF